MTDKQKKRILDAYNDYVYREYSEEGLDELPEGGVLPIAFTTYEFDDNAWFTHEIQVNFDLDTMQWMNYIDDELVLAQPSDVDSLVGSLGASFDDIIRDCLSEGFRLESEHHFDEWKKSIGGTYDK